MKIIGAGFSRTATSSLKEALSLLDYKTYHMLEVISLNHFKLVEDTFIHSNPVSFFGKLEELGYNSTTDLPGALLYQEFISVYPNSKVILTVRNMDRWFESWRNLMKMSILQAAFPFNLADSVYTMTNNSFGLSTVKRNIAACHPLLQEHLLYQPWFLPWVSFSYDVEIEKEKCIQRHLDHIDEVKRMVSADRLLVFNVSDGWKPLCDFLNVSVPSVEFPHLNDESSIRNIRLFFAFVHISWPLFFFALFHLLKKIIVRQIWKKSNCKSITRAKKTL